MAQLVHDSLDSGRRVYVELGNENWNYAFPLAHQIQAEGLAAGLDTNAFAANLKRYSQKTVWAMKIWAKVFADRPGQLVRVASAQAPTPGSVSRSWPRPNSPPMSTHSPSRPIQPRQGQ